MLRVNAELTDTFGGEANYSWVRRATIIMQDNSTDLQIVRRVKRELGLTGVKCTRNDFGDMLELRPRGYCQVCFITFESVESR